jgi:hypothetical protein
MTAGVDPLRPRLRGEADFPYWVGRSAPSTPRGGGLPTLGGASSRSARPSCQLRSDRQLPVEIRLNPAKLEAGQSLHRSLRKFQESEKSYLTTGLRYARITLNELFPSTYERRTNSSRVGPPCASKARRGSFFCLLGSRRIDGVGQGGPRCSRGRRRFFSAILTKISWDPIRRRMSRAPRRLDASHLVDGCSREMIAVVIDSISGFPTTRPRWLKPDEIDVPIRA